MKIAIFIESEHEVAQSCPTLCDPIDCSPPGSFLHGILQARILEWVAISFSRESSRPRDRTQVFCIVDRRFTVWATRELYSRSLLVIYFIYSSVYMLIPIFQFITPFPLVSIGLFSTSITLFLVCK